MRKIYRFKLIKRLGFDPLFFFSRRILNKKTFKIPFFGFRFLFKRIFALSAHKRRLFFSVFRDFGRFKPSFLYFRRLNRRRSPKTNFIKVLFSSQALRNFYYFKRLRTLKRFFKFSKFKKKSLSVYKSKFNTNGLFRSSVPNFYTNRLSPVFKVSSVISKRRRFLTNNSQQLAFFRMERFKNRIWGRKVHFLEFRLFSVLIRSGFYLTPVSLLRSLRSGDKIFLNSRAVSSPNVLLTMGDIITFSESESQNIKIRVARIFRGVFFKKFFKKKITTVAHFKRVFAHTYAYKYRKFTFEKYQENAKSKEQSLRKKFFFYDHYFHFRYCRRLPVFLLPFSSRHFIVSYSFPMIFISSNAVNALSLAYPFTKSIAKLASYFYSRLR